MWRARRRLAGHCGNTVKNHGAVIVSCNKKAPTVKEVKTTSSLSAEKSHFNQVEYDGKSFFTDASHPPTY